MKKKLITVGLVLVSFVGCKTILTKMENMSSVPQAYYDKIQTVQPLEAKYTKMGSHAFKSKDCVAQGKAFQNYKIWYPADMETSNKQYPVVVFANGTGVVHTKYQPLFEHLASWGFIAIGNDDKNSWNGLSSSQSLDLLLKENNDRSSIFYKKLNTSQIGVSGHSQGGVAVVNAITNQPNSNLFHSAFGASTTKHDLSVFLQWPYDIGKVKIPYFAVAGTGASDAGDGKDKSSGIAPLWSMAENFNKISSNKPNVRARRKDTFHEQMLYRGDGYMTAWFLYTLTNDNEAKMVFSGSSPELKQNVNWQDVEIKNIK